MALHVEEERGGGVGGCFLTQGEILKGELSVMELQYHRHIRIQGPFSGDARAKRGGGGDVNSIH